MKKILCLLCLFMAATGCAGLGKHEQETMRSEAFILYSRYAEKLNEITPITYDYYKEIHLGPKVVVVVCGRNVPAAVRRYNATYGRDIEIPAMKWNEKVRELRSHSFLSSRGPDPFDQGFSARNEYVIFIEGDDCYLDWGSAKEFYAMILGGKLRKF